MNNNIPVIIWFNFQKHVRYLDSLFNSILRSIDFQEELLAVTLR